MGNILWSVDKKIYSDKEDHTLAITGWAITRNQSECDFILYGSGKELSVPEPSRCERADVAKDLKETKDIKEVGNVGFTVKIPEIIKLAEEHEKLQLALRAEIHQNLIFNTTGCIGRQLNIFIHVKRVDRLDETDRPDRNQIFHAHAGVVKLSCYVDHQAQVVFDQRRTRLFILTGSKFS